MTAITKMNIDLAKNEVVFTRIVDGPRALVFKAWTDPRHMAQWWGPHTFTNPVCEMDVRPGGIYRILMRGPDGVEYPLKGVYREILEPERLVYTQDLAEFPAEWKDALQEELRKAGRKLVVESLMTVKFAEHGGKTKLTIQTRFDSVVLRDAMLKRQMAEGWAESLERLEQHLDQIARKEKEN
jgi:uncharacterized protein YndB with AHSA1/START domain